jgi:hypothetical protein
MSSGSAQPVRSRLRRGAAPIFFVALAGCFGQVQVPTLPGGEVPVNPFAPAAPAETRFSCDQNAHGTASSLARLSSLQYRNTLHALFAGAPNFDATTVAAAAIAKLPVDAVEGTFAGNDDRLSDGHVQAFYDVAEVLAQAVVDDPVVLSTIGGSCATQTAPTPACIDGFLNGFAARTYRRPLTQGEHDRYTALNDGTRDGKELFRSLLFSVLMAPQFLYHAEVEGTAIDGVDSFWVLDPYALASRLSYHFWQELPDAALFAAAKDGSLATEAGYQVQLQRVVADPRTRRTMTGFYREWFQLGRISQFVPSPAFNTFAEGTTVGTAGADHLAAAGTEIEDLTGHFTFDAPGTVRDLITSNASFTKSPHLAAIYGVPVWDGTSAPPLLPSPQRAGLLTRLAFLASGNHQTNPIHRGAIVRRRLMCTTLVPPPVGALPPDSVVPPPPSTTLTTRERYANKVVNEPCATCHAQMNPIGYVLEQYDSLGRFRTQERLFDEATGAQVNVLPIDASAAPWLLADDGTLAATGADLSRLLADTGTLEACFARQYFRFTYRRAESNADGCVLERVRTQSATRLRDALIDVANDESFKTRKVELP